MRRIPKALRDDRLVAIGYLEKLVAGAGRLVDETKKRAMAATAAADTAARYHDELQTALNVTRRDVGVVFSVIAPGASSDRAGTNGTGSRGSERSGAACVRGAICAQQGDFSAADIIAWLKHHESGMAAKLPKNYVFAILWKLSHGRNPLIAVVKKGGKGSLTTYRLLLAN